MCFSRAESQLEFLNFFDETKQLLFFYILLSFNIKNGWPTTAILDYLPFITICTRAILPI